MAELQNHDGYASFEISVVADGDNPSVIELEIWACPEEDTDAIAVGLTLAKDYDLVSIASEPAQLLADALEQATPAEIAVIDHSTAGEEQRTLHVSFDHEGCDLLFALAYTTTRLVLDFDEASDIASAIRQAVAYLATAGAA